MPAAPHPAKAFPAGTSAGALNTSPVLTFTVTPSLALAEIKNRESSNKRESKKASKRFIVFPPF
jgi:hypothetical protein